MTRHRLIPVTVLIVGLVFFTIASASVGANVGTEPDAACKEAASGATILVVTLPDGSVHTDQVSLHPESTAAFVLCEDGKSVPPEDGQEWNLTDNEAFASAEPADQHWAVEIGANATTLVPATLVVGASIDGGAQVQIVTGSTAASEFEGVDRLGFEGQSARDKYLRKQGVYTETTAAIEASSADLETIKEAIEAEGIDPTLREEAEGTLLQLRSDHDQLLTTGAELRLLLFESAYGFEPGSRERIKALESLESSERSATANASNSVAAYSSTVETEHAAVADRFWGFVRLGGVGLLIGAVGGGLFVRNRASDTAYFSAFDSDSSYDARVLLWPVVVSVVLFVLGAGVLWYTGSWSAVFPVGWGVTG